MFKPGNQIILSKSIYPELSNIFDDINLVDLLHTFYALSFCFEKDNNCCLKLSKITKTRLLREFFDYQYYLLARLGDPFMVIKDVNDGNISCYTLFKQKTLLLAKGPDIYSGEIMCGGYAIYWLTREEFLAFVSINIKL